MTTVLPRPIPPTALGFCTWKSGTSKRLDKPNEGEAIARRAQSPQKGTLGLREGCGRGGGAAAAGGGGEGAEEASEAEA